MKMPEWKPGRCRGGLSGLIMTTVAIATLSRTTTSLSVPAGCRSRQQVLSGFRRISGHTSVAVADRNNNCKTGRTTHKSFISRPSLQQRSSFVKSTQLTATSSSSSVSAEPDSLHQAQHTNYLSIKECMDLFEQQNNSAGTESDVHFIDCTWFHKGGRDGRSEFLTLPRIPGSHYFDIMDIATNGDVFPDANPRNLYNMFPPIQLLTSLFDKMGVTTDRGLGKATSSMMEGNVSSASTSTTTIVIYGREGTLFAPRVWYMIHKYFENNPHVRVCIMEEPFEMWIKEGGAVETDVLGQGDGKDTSSTIWTTQDLVADYLESSSQYSQSEEYPMRKVAHEHLVEMDDVRELVKKLQSQEAENNALPYIVDTRGSSYAKGHMPKSIHIPYSSLTMSDNAMKLKPRNELVKILSSKLGFDVDQAIKNKTGADTDDVNNVARPILLTCGSAVSVCHMALVLNEIGYPYEPVIYDGSWNEWGSDPSTPKEGLKSSQMTVH